jgi:hypothetical protein
MSDRPGNGFFAGCDFILTHCLQPGKPPCKHWDTDYVEDTCKGIPWSMGIRCTGHKPIKKRVTP